MNYNKKIIGTLGIWLFTTISFGQTYDQIIKLRAEYEKLKEAQENQLPTGQSMAQGEDSGPTRVLYRPGDLEEFYRIQLSQLTQSIEEINSISSFFDSTAGFAHYGYNIFSNRDSISYFENMPIPDNYSLGVGDELIISLWGEVEREEKANIKRDGSIFLEDVGLINLNGKTLLESKSIIRNKYGQTYATIKGKTPKTFLDVSVGKLKGLNVHILGFVNYPGVYALHPFSDPFTALFQAGGIDTTGSLRNIELYRGGEKINTIDLYQIIHGGKINKQIRLNDQDIIFIPPRESKVLLNGQILKPGYFELIEGETGEDLVKFSGGLNPIASSIVTVKRIHSPINRNNDDESMEYLSININDLSDFTIINGDSLGIGEISSFHPTVTINGWVKRPGQYPFIKGQTLSELLETGGGLTDKNWIKGAEKTIRRISLGDNGERVTSKYDLHKILNNEIDIPLLPFDEVIINKKSNYQFGETVIISGEVRARGTYSINRRTIRDLINEAGGITSNAYLDGVELFRDTTQIGLNDLSMIPINGDSIHVPHPSGIITVLGAVNNPGSIAYESGIGLIDFIDRAGGYTIYANKKDIYVIYPNGIAMRKARFTNPKITEGSTIMVSTSQLVVQQLDYLEVSQQIASIIGSLATVALIINTQK